MYYFALFFSFWAFYCVLPNITPADSLKNAFFLKSSSTQKKLMSAVLLWKLALSLHNTHIYLCMILFVYSIFRNIVMSVKVKNKWYWTRCTSCCIIPGHFCDLNLHLWIFQKSASPSWNQPFQLISRIKIVIYFAPICKINKLVTIHTKL